MARRPDFEDLKRAAGLPFAAGRADALLQHAEALVDQAPTGRTDLCPEAAGAADAEPVVRIAHDGEWVLDARFSPDGTLVVSVGNHVEVRVWQADLVGDPVGLPVSGDAADFSPDGRRVAIVDGAEEVTYNQGQIWTAVYTVRVWQADGAGDPIVMKCPHPSYSGYDGPIGFTGVSFSPDGRQVATSEWGGKVRLWPTDGIGKPRTLYTHDAMAQPPHPHVASSVSFSPDGRLVASGGADSTVRLGRTEGAPWSMVLRGHEGVVRSASFSPDGRRVVSASVDYTVRLWPADGQADPIVLRGHGNTVHAASFSPDGRLVASADADGAIRLWQVDTVGKPLILYGHVGPITAVSFSPDGRRLVSAGLDGTVRLWPVPSQ